MIQRITPALIAITFLLSGCVQQQSDNNIASFDTGSTLLKIAHLPSPTSDGSSLFITVDGKNVGQLPVGEAVLLKLPAGEHQVGGYARSIIGGVTVPALKVTTSTTGPRFVAYRVARYDPLLKERGIDPLPDSAPIPKKPVAQSQAVPMPQIDQISPPKTESKIVSEEPNSEEQKSIEANTPETEKNTVAQDSSSVEKATNIAVSKTSDTQESSTSISHSSTASDADKQWAEKIIQSLGISTLIPSIESNNDSAQSAVAIPEKK